MSKPVLITIIIAAVFLCIAAFAGLLAFLSYQTTQYYWDGGYPPSEVQLTITDENGEPIHGAQVIVLNAVTGEAAHEYPFIEYTSSNTPSSDADGAIILHQELIGIQFGGSGWDLFWIFPMGSQDAPMYTIEIKADGFQTKSLGIWDLLNAATGEVQTTTYDLYGDEFEMFIYPHTIILSPIQ